MRKELWKKNEFWVSSICSNLLVIHINESICPFKKTFWKHFRKITAIWGRRETILSILIKHFDSLLLYGFAPMDFVMKLDDDKKTWLLSNLHFPAAFLLHALNLHMHLILFFFKVHNDRSPPIGLQNATYSEVRLSRLELSRISANLLI